MKNIYLHIGTHKTGSTSLQRWMLEHEPFLNTNGFILYKGAHKTHNHVELYLAAMRYERDSFGKQARPEIKFDESYTSEVSKQVQTFISKCNDKNLILSTEGLSLLRHRDEIQKLATILGADYENIKIILYLRDKKDYLSSYRLQLQKKGRKPSTNYWSALYVEDDTWLIDYEQLITAYGDVFGLNNIVVIDYDKEMKSRSNIIPSFVETIGLECSIENEREFQSYYRNAALSLASHKPKKATILRRLLKKLNIG